MEINIQVYICKWKSKISHWTQRYLHQGNAIAGHSHSEHVGTHTSSAMKRNPQRPHKEDTPAYEHRNQNSRTHLWKHGRKCPNCLVIKETYCMFTAIIHETMLKNTIYRELNIHKQGESTNVIESISRLKLENGEFLQGVNDHFRLLI